MWVPAALAVVLGAPWIVDALVDAYGANPPYYSRSTNMDKWTSPWPPILFVIGSCIVVVAITFWIWRATSGRRIYGVRRPIAASASLR
jgi:hypothetical protein